MTKCQQKIGQKEYFSIFDPKNNVYSQVKLENDKLNIKELKQINNKFVNIIWKKKDDTEWKM